MNLRINVFGFEVASIELETPEPTVVEEVETVAETLITKVMQNKTVGKLIGRISTVWVATGMQR